MNERIEEFIEILAHTRGKWGFLFVKGIIRHKTEFTCPLQYSYDHKVNKERHVALTDEDVDIIVKAVDNRPKHDRAVRQKFIDTLIGE